MLWSFSQLLVHRVTFVTCQLFEGYVSYVSLASVMDISNEDALTLGREADGNSEEMEVSIDLPDIQHLIADLKEKKIQIVSVVETLGPFLTSTNVDIRIQGVKAFNDILASLPTDFLVETQLSFIATFYADRLNDNHKVVPTVFDGVLSIIKMKNLTKEISRVILKSLFDNVPCQQQIRTDRHKIYTILDSFITNHIEDVKTMGTDFVLGLVFSMDGERDPRNLLFLFSILPPFLKEANLGHVAEEMFEVLACYFPVDFNTPQDDPNAITRENLAESLSSCLSASSAFAEFCLPLVLEKLDSNLKVAKFDSMKLLKCCCTTYKVSSFDPHLGSLWQALFKEIIQETDLDLKNQALECLSELISHFSQEKSNATCERFLKEILVPTKIHLLEAKTKSKYESYVKLLLYVANASSVACTSVMQDMNSALIHQFNMISDDAIKAVIVNYFMSVFEACKKLNMSLEYSVHFKFMYEIIETSTKSTHLDLKLAGFKSLGVMAELLTSSEATVFLDVLKFSVDREKNTIIADAGQIALINLIKLHSSNFKMFINELCELNLVMDNIFILHRRLNLICSLICIEDYTHFVVKKLMNLMYNSDIKTTILILEILSNVLHNKDLFDDLKLDEIETKYNMIDSILQLVDKIIIDIDEEKLNNILKIIVKFMKSQDSSKQLKSLNTLIPKYMEQMSQKNNFAIVAIEALLNSSRQDLNIDCIECVISSALYSAKSESRSYIQEKACKLIANVLNKYYEHSVVSKSYENIKNTAIATLKSDHENDIEYSNVISLISWLAKCFLHIRHSDCTYWLKMLIEMLEHEKWRFYVAKQFKLIMMDSDAISFDCFCKYNFLYRQKVFQIFLHSMMQSEMKFKNESQCLALGYIVQYVPRMALLIELPKIKQVLLDCLCFNEPELSFVILDTLTFLIQNGKFSSGLQTLLSSCIRLSDKINPIKIRVASLQCLFEIANIYPTNQLLHYKQDIILELAKRLDDPKRLVRNMAVKARTRWFLVGSPGEDKDK